MNDVDNWRTAVLMTAALGQTIFAVLYLTTFPWWKALLGRTLFFKAATFALLLDAVVLARVLDLKSEPLFFLPLYALLSVAVWAQLVSFIMIRTKAKGLQDD